MKPRVHPKYKTTHRVGNCAEYDRALVRRGDVTLWLTPDAIAHVGSGWRRQAERATPVFRSRLRNRPNAQSHRPLTVASDRGLLDIAFFGMLGVDHAAPDHTTLSRREQHLALALRRACPGTRLHLIVDSTGLTIVGDGEWAAATHGGRGATVAGASSISALTGPV